MKKVHRLLLEIALGASAPKWRTSKPLRHDE